MPSMLTHSNAIPGSQHGARATAPTPASRGQGNCNTVRPSARTERVPGRESTRRRVQRFRGSSSACQALASGFRSQEVTPNRRLALILRFEEEGTERAMAPTAPRGQKGRRAVSAGRNVPSAQKMPSPASWDRAEGQAEPARGPGGPSILKFCPRPLARLSAQRPGLAVTAADPVFYLLLGALRSFARSQPLSSVFEKNI